ncbi:hypothetical protein PG993_006227 [Apiospora rasikravindrae]|uniref:Protein kinase domain-containing protein n=1 Tax=Apiospora rasikravindrae TaxID=990691 RepID=A0ABR1T778_9PEZI
MESYLPLGGFQLPFQRRLSRLYNDTKKSSDFVKEPSSEDPEIKALHRKLKIQKDRLVSWGLEWSDPSNQSAEIDESLSKAGLSDLVGSIMSTIKDILAEAEPLWLSSKRRIGEKEPERPTGDKKLPIVVWDKTRFEDLIKDLTASIDTLHDLSRTRSSVTSSSRIGRLAKSQSSLEELRPFGSTRMQKPQEIDPQTLTNIQTMQAVPLASPITSERRSQEIVFMGKQAFADVRRGRQGWSPLLLEFAQFDPIYSTTGIMPSMSRFEKLSAGLQTESHRSPGAWSGLPLLLGYYEDMENSRLGLVYQFPATFSPVTFENLTQNPIDNLYTLSELLSRPDFEPRLEAKFRLAHNLANTVFDMHARGITHGNLLDSTISFCSPTGSEHSMEEAEVDVRKPLVSSFDLFPEDGPALPASVGTTLYRHPLDPRTTPHSPLVSSRDSKTLDLYSLAMLLVSIGLWTKLENLVPSPSSPSIPESVLEQLAIRCGTLYMKAVQACWNAVDQELMRPGASDEILSQVQVRASRYLEACSILDGVSGLDDRISVDIGDVPVTPRERQSSFAVSMPGPSKGDTKARSPATSFLSGPRLEPAFVSGPEKRASGLAELPWDQGKSRADPITTEKAEVATPSEKPKPSKARLYPQIPLPDDAVMQWNNVVMPQINMALKHFYRKNPESVEISLESIGESPQEITPTVLVVCTSVSKVRSILKKKLGILFDGSTGFGLKVCRGSMLRSRKGGITRSMAKGDDEESDMGKGEAEAANPDYQERPHNGASIGAWIGDRHLPPVSFGGLIMVDDKPYGMTVHHMLDDPDQGHSQKDDLVPPVRSSAASQSFSLQEADTSESSSGDDFACEFSDTESEVTDLTSDDESDEEDDEEYMEPGDIPGIEPGLGEGYVVTQPALDDIGDGFYPSEDTMDDDHLDTCRLGEIYASSGIRRRHDHEGLIHEIDWALFSFEDERFPDRHDQNRVPQALPESPSGLLQPTAITSSSELAGLEVQCIGRTSGMQTGLILPALTSVKIYGRASPSHTYQVSSKAAPSVTGSKVGPNMREHAAANMRRIPGLSLGVPGDSGAWIIERHSGSLCGHVLAWSERKQVAYICPMEVLMLDIAETLEASDVRLPGGRSVLSGRRQEVDEEEEDEDEGLGVDADEAPDLTSSMRRLAEDLDRIHMESSSVVSCDTCQ